MPDGIVSVRYGKQLKHVDGYKTRSPYLWIVPANDESCWTIASTRVHATFGAFKAMRTAQLVVGVLIEFQLDKVDFVVRGDGWGCLPITLPIPIKHWLLEVAKDNVIPTSSDI